ncbi:MAG: hypothetical protein FJ298_14540 [Planctomycetes bacterium]|nr:hypothetical protein [Planctomycetota bacterium]
MAASLTSPVLHFRALLASLLLCVGLAHGQSSRDAELAAARAATVFLLEDLVAYTGTAKLYLERDRAWEAIVRLEPGNEGAHKGLKHTKNRDGSWKVPEKPAASKNFGKDLTECARRRAQIAALHRDALVTIATRRGLAPTARRALYDELLAIDPDDAQSRALLGEARRDDLWVLAETVSGKTRRGELRALVKELVAAVPAPAKIEPREREAPLGVTWSACFATPKVRVFSSGDAAEALNVAVQCTAAVELFRRVTSAPKDVPDVVDLYLLTSVGARDAFVAAWPGWSAEERSRVKTWAGTGLPNEIHHARWDADAPKRLDGAVRHMLGLLTLYNYGFDHQKSAWAWEGFGLYLTRELVGTHYTWYSTGPTSGDAESKELLGKLMMGDANWMNEAFQRSKRGKGTKIAALCSRPIDTFGVDDVLTAYALAAYLLEGRADRVGPLLTAIGAGPSDKALAETLELTPAELDARLVRWMGERK